MKTPEQTPATMAHMGQLQVGLVMAVAHVFTVLAAKGIMSQAEGAASLDAAIAISPELPPLAALTLRQIARLLRDQTEPDGAPPTGSGPSLPVTRFRVISGGKA